MNNEITAALKTLNIPVSFLHYSGDESTYITFFFYDEINEESSDDEEEIEGYYPQIDLWSNSDCTLLVLQIKAAMKSAGFIFTNKQDLYEKDTGIYHIALRFCKAMYLK